jgi:hypothetical protein
MRLWYWAGALALACGPVSAQQDRLDAQRSRVTQEADAAERACNESFAVTDCVKKVQTKQRQQLVEIKREETALHDLQRKQQAADQTRQTAEKQTEHDQQLAQKQGVASEADKRKLQQEDKRRQHREIATGVKTPNAGATRQAPQAIQGYRSEWERKQQDAEKKRLDRNRRLQDTAKSKPVAGLPTTPR